MILSFTVSYMIRGYFSTKKEEAKNIAAQAQIQEQCAKNIERGLVEFKSEYYDFDCGDFSFSYLAPKKGSVETINTPTAIWYNKKHRLSDSLITSSEKDAKAALNIVLAEWKKTRDYQEFIDHKKTMAQVEERLSRYQVKQKIMLVFEMIIGKAHAEESIRQMNCAKPSKEALRPYMQFLAKSMDFEQGFQAPRCESYY